MISLAVKTGRAALVSAALLAGVAGVAACGPAHRAGVATTGTPAAASSTVGSVPAAPVTRAVTPTTAVGQLPTVPNCGGGAYKPSTLLIVCGTGTTMATGVSWRSWQRAAASGSGTVHLQVKGQPVSAPAVLLLSDVVNGAVGPQFTLLTVTWTGTPPDGKARDTYRLQVVG